MSTPVKGKKLDDNQKKYNLGKARVLCENFYGRLKGLWSVMAVTFRWDHWRYDDIMKILRGTHCFSYYCESFEECLL